MFKKKSNKVFVFIIALMFVSMSIGTVGASPQKPKKKELMFWTWGDWTLFEAGWDLFIKENPQYKEVTFKHFKPARAETIPEYVKHLLTAYAAGTGLPDCLEVPSIFVPIFGSRGILMDLTKRIEPYQNDLPGPVLDSVTFDDKVWAVPWRSNISEMYYRKDVFDMAGVNIESIETWDDFIRVGKKITGTLGGKERYMVNVGATTIDFDIKMFPFFSYYGLGIFDPVTGDTIIDKDPRVKEAIALSYRFVKEGIALRMDDWSGAWWAALKEGRVASLLAANWFPEVIKGVAPETKGKWRVALPPAFSKGGSRYGFQAGTANLAGISATEIPDIVWEYMRSFCLSVETPAELNKTRWQTPCYLPAQKHPIFQQPSEFFGGQKIRDIVFEAQEGVKPFHITSHYLEASKYISDELMKAIEGEKDIDQAIKDAAAAIRQRIGKSF